MHLELWLVEHSVVSPPPTLDFAGLILRASNLAVQFLPGVSVLTQEFQPNPILLRRDEGEVNS